MSEKCVLLCFAAYYLLITAANPLRELLLLPFNKNNNYLQNLAFASQSPASNFGHYSLYNGAQNTCPAQSYQGLSSNDLHQLLYRTLLEKNIQKPFLCNNNNQLSVPNQINGVGCLQQEPRITKPEIVNNYIIVPQEVLQANNLRDDFKPAPREIRKRRQDSEHAGERKRKRKNQHAMKRESDTNVDNNRESSRNKGTDREIPAGDAQPRKRSRKRNQDRKTNEEERDGKRRRKKPKTERVNTSNATYVVDRDSIHITENNNINLNKTKSQDKLAKNETSNSAMHHETHSNTTNDAKIYTATNEIHKTDMPHVTNTGNNLNATKNTNSTRRQKNKKSNQNNRAKENHKSTIKNSNNREDILIRDFREKFPNIPEELLKKLINYMRKQLENEQSSLSDAYYKYLNYPINLDQFYQTQMAKIVSNPQITRVNNNKHSSKRKSNRRNSRKKGKKKKSNDCSTVVELIPQIIEKQIENTTFVDPDVNINSTKTDLNKTVVQNKPVKLEFMQIEEPILELKPKVTGNINKTVTDPVSNNNFTEIEKKLKNETENETMKITQKHKVIELKLTHEKHENIIYNNSAMNTSKIEQNTTEVGKIDEQLKTIQKQENLGNIISHQETKQQTNPSKLFTNKPETSLVFNKTVEHPKNERIINIRISIEPQQKPTEKDRSAIHKNLPQLKEELNMSKSDMSATKSSKPENHTENMEASRNNSINETTFYVDKEVNELIEPLDDTRNDIINKTSSIQTEKPSETIKPFKNLSEKIKTHDDIMIPALGEEDVVPTIEMNEIINDYFPNFEVDNFAYLLEGDKHELEKLQDSRYHYTTDRNVGLEESNKKTDPFGNYEKILPKKAVIDNENVKTYTSVEETIQRPLKDEEGKVEFVTPPTLEIPDFETKPVRTDKPDRFIFYDPEADYAPQRYQESMDEPSVYSDMKSHYTTSKISMEDIDTISTHADSNSPNHSSPRRFAEEIDELSENSDMKPPYYNAPKSYIDDVSTVFTYPEIKSSHIKTPKRYIEDMDKSSVYSDVKSPHYDMKAIRDKEKNIANDIETIFAQSKVVKYGHDSENLNAVKDSSENLIHNEVNNNKNGNVSIVFAKSFPW